MLIVTMSSTSDSIEQKKEELTKKNDNYLTTLNWRSYGLLMLLFLIVQSDIFNETILSCIPGAIENRELTLTGAIISGLILCVAHIFLMYNIFE